MKNKISMNFVKYEPQHMGEVHDEMMYIDCTAVEHSKIQPNHPIVNVAEVNPNHIFDAVFSIMNMHTKSQLLLQISYTWQMKKQTNEFWMTQ